MTNVDGREKETERDYGEENMIYISMMEERKDADGMRDKRSKN